jgi:hypothetical protein
VVLAWISPERVIDPWPDLECPFIFLTDCRRWMIWSTQSGAPSKPNWVQRQVPCGSTTRFCGMTMYPPRCPTLRSRPAERQLPPSSRRYTQRADGTTVDGSKRSHVASNPAQRARHQPVREPQSSGTLEGGPRLALGFGAKPRARSGVRRMRPKVSVSPSTESRYSLAPRGALAFSFDTSGQRLRERSRYPAGQQTAPV